MHSKLLIIILLTLFCLHTRADEQITPATANAAVKLPTEQVPTLDLRNAEWGSGKEFKLDGLWHAYWGQFLNPEDIQNSDIQPFLFPVPGVWSDQPRKKNRFSTNEFTPDPQVLMIAGEDQEDSERVLPALGFMTYHARVLLPESLKEAFLYIPDMPSAYKLFANGELVSSNGETGFFQNTEQPGFLPKVVKLNPQGELDLVIH